jgi:hypothetical protein
MTSLILPAVTLWQPWACLIEIGVKRYEARHFRIPWRLLGRRVAIHAAARRCSTDLDEDTLDAITEAFGRCGWNHWLPRGAVTCTAILAESLPAENVPADPFGDYSPFRWAWRLEDVRPVRPHIPAKGRQLIGWDWTVPDRYRGRVELGLEDL